MMSCGWFMRRGIARVGYGLDRGVCRLAHFREHEGISCKGGNDWQETPMPNSEAFRFLHNHYKDRLLPIGALRDSLFKTLFCMSHCEICEKDHLSCPLR